MLHILMMLIPRQDAVAPEGDDVLRLERFIGPFYAFRDVGVEIVIASPEGGFPTMGLPPHDQSDSEPMRRFSADRTARDALSDTLRLDQAFAEDFDAAFCIGHPGAVWRDPNPAGSLIAALLKAGKPVAVIPSNLDLSPFGVGDGLLIMGDRAATPVLAAHALLGALGEGSTTRERGSS
jgi:hypothetical protein